MRLYSPGRFQLQSQETSTIVLGGTKGERFSIYSLESDIIRVRHCPTGKPKFNRTWLITDANGDTPLNGRDKDDYSRFSNPHFIFEEQNADEIRLNTEKLHLKIELDPLRLSWFDDDGNCIAEDLTERAYSYDSESRDIYHFLKRSADMRFYGFGEKSGKLNKHGRRMRMFNLDAGRYNAELSDPLYKHVPFYITFLPELQIAYGLLYDSLATCVFDMGSEHHNFLPPYRYYQADDGDLDYYFIYGPSIAAVLEKLASLTGRMHLPPRWTLGYMGSTMTYTEAEDAQSELRNFPRLCQEHDIPCDLFHLSSGYTKMADGKRYVFHWNRNRVPEPQKMVQDFHDHDIRLAANVKPCLLTSHPRFEEVKSFDGFVKTEAGDEPQLDAFWDGQGGHLDFTSSETFDWWKQNIEEHLLKYGIDAIWNDNNEYTIWDDNAQYAGFGDPCAVSLAGRPLQTLLMARASYEALSEHAPGSRPYLITRSGCPGIQRYAQTWTGDNNSDWHTLQYNIPMGLGLSLSGMPNVGHDVGGFFGTKPDPELFVRWIQNGIFQPRFTIHSWHDDGSVNEPWMYPEFTDTVRNLIRFRYSMIPYLYSLFVEASRSGGHLITRPLVCDFPHDQKCLDESFDYLLGPHWLVASVWQPGVRERNVYLPQGDMWCDFASGAWYEGSTTVRVEAPLERTATMVRAGGLIPTGKPEKARAKSDDDKRLILAYPAPGIEETGAFILYEDDGDTDAYRRGERTSIALQMNSDKHLINISTYFAEKGYKLPYKELEWIFPQGEKRDVIGADRSWRADDERIHAIVKVPGDLHD